MPEERFQHVMPGTGGPATVDLYSGVIAINEAGLGPLPAPLQGAAAQMYVRTGVPLKWVDRESEYSLASHSRHVLLSSWAPTVYEALKTALEEAANRGLQVHTVQIHPWFAGMPDLWGASDEEIQALGPQVEVWHGLQPHDGSSGN